MMEIPEGATHILDNGNFLMFDDNGIEHAWYDEYGWSTCYDSKSLSDWLSETTVRITELKRGTSDA